MLVERKTLQGFTGKVYIVLVDGKVKAGFSEHQTPIALALANEWIEDHLDILTRAGHLAHVKYN